MVNNLRSFERSELERNRIFWSKIESGFGDAVAHPNQKFQVVAHRAQRSWIPFWPERFFQSLILLKRPLGGISRSLQHSLSGCFSYFHY